MTDLEQPGTPTPASPEAVGAVEPGKGLDPDADELSWLSTLVVTGVGAVTVGTAWFLMALIAVVVTIGFNGLDEIRALSSNDLTSSQTQDAVVDLVSQTIGALVVVTIVVWLAAAALYMLFLDLFFGWKLKFGWALLAVAVGWVAGLFGGIIDVFAGLLTLGLASAACNALAAGAIVKKAATRP